MIIYYSFKINFAVKTLKQAQKKKWKVKRCKRRPLKKKLFEILTLTPCNKIY